MDSRHVKLPPEFLERMHAELGDSFQAFEASYSDCPRKGIRANLLKTNREELLDKLPADFQAQPVPWCSEGLYIDSKARPGKNLGYYTGLYYPQEPSAMLPAQALAPEKGELILDLCAAPGGKSTQIASLTGGTGTLVSNELVKSRSGILASNIERMGIPNAVILNEFPERLVPAFYEKFDRILTDAPCSGEGMFRKDPAVAGEWTPGRPAACAARQKNILKTVDKLLKPGGTLVYSTCTFAPEENEEIARYLVESGRYVQEPLSFEGIEPQIDPLTGNPAKDVHVYPHLAEGEGHYVARFTKTESCGEKPSGKRKALSPWKNASKRDLADYEKFRTVFMPDKLFENLHIRDDKLYALPEHIHSDVLSGLKVIKPGLEIGSFRKGRFEPSHSLAMALKADEVSNSAELTEDELWCYLRGEEIRPAVPVVNGWTLVLYDGCPVGFGKTSNGVIKNKYPKGLRIYKK
ncbi:MAG: RsmF rRNA methyltransferase first C-terminal domain-containing protein [Eubacteriaceae bacterium]|jgi:NOL1/NOP2/sun family putative RNA methylase